MTEHRKPAARPAEDKAMIPSDRDEKATPPTEDGQHHKNREPIRQAHHDVESGIQDTERIGTPTHVPSSKGNSAEP